MTLEETIQTTVDELSEEWDEYSDSDNEQGVFDEANWIVSEHSAAELVDYIERNEGLDTWVNDSALDDAIRSTACRIIEQDVTHRVENRTD